MICKVLTAKKCGIFASDCSYLGRENYKTLFLRERPFFAQKTVENRIAEDNIDPKRQFYDRNDQLTEF
jgi:hypothetical protein